MKKLALFSLIVLTTACNPVLFLMDGIRNPRTRVSQEKIIRFATEAGIDTARIVFWTSAEAKTAFWQKHNYTPDLNVYNSNGFFLPYRDTSACNAAGFSLARELCQYPFGSPDTSDQLAYYLSSIRKSDGTPLASTLRPGQDYTVLISWARFVGNPIKTHLPDWQKDLERIQDCSVDYYYICFDRLKRKRSR